MNGYPKFIKVSFKDGKQLYFVIHRYQINNQDTFYWSFDTFYDTNANLGTQSDLFLSQLECLLSLCLWLLDYHPAQGFTLEFL